MYNQNFINYYIHENYPYTLPLKRSCNKFLYYEIKLIIFLEVQSCFVCYQDVSCGCIPWMHGHPDPAQLHCPVYSPCVHTYVELKVTTPAFLYGSRPGAITARSKSGISARANYIGIF